MTPEAKTLRKACANFSKDLHALPETAFAHQFGEKTRTVADIVYEVILVNDHVGMCIRGEEPFDWPESQWITAPNDFNTKSVVVEAFDASAAKITETADSFSEEDLKVAVQTEHGETNRSERLRFMALHLWYHSGQLNFIQTLLGDDGWHWN